MRLLPLLGNLQALKHLCLSTHVWQSAETNFSISGQGSDTVFGIILPVSPYTT